MREISWNMIKWIKRYEEENHVSVKITFDDASFGYFIKMKLGQREIIGFMPRYDEGPAENEFSLKYKIGEMFRGLSLGVI